MARNNDLHTNSPAENSLDSIKSMENDSVWDLLDASPARKASPVFLQNTLREIRLAEADKPTPWWKKILSPKPLAASALAACAAVAIIVNLPSGSDSQDIADKDPIPADPSPLAEVENSLADELLLSAAENPSLFSDQEVLAFLY